MSEETETLLEFPCDFPIKAMGEAQDDFAALVISLVERHTDKLDSSAIKQRASANSKYLSVTITITAQSRTQLDNIYYELTAEPRVLMAL